MVLLYIYIFILKEHKTSPVGCKRLAIVQHVIDIGKHHMIFVPTVVEQDGARA